MFFSVKAPVKIAGKVYTPCICYEANEALTSTIEKLVTEGRAYKFSNRVYFQNGKVIEKKPEAKEDKALEKSKKTKKEKTVPAADTEDTVEATETIPSPEEVADDLGGF